MDGGPSLEESLARMETNIDWIRVTLEKNCGWKEKADTRMGKCEERVGRLENYRSVLLGGFGLLTLLITYGWIVPGS